MEWPQEKGLVRSGFALHAGRLLEQYTGLTREMHPALRHDATLAICVLQTMLANCWELYMYLDDRQRSEVLGPINDFVETLLAEDDVEFASSFPGDADQLTARAFIKHIRDALSHPTFRVTDPPTTGYTTVGDGSGYVGRMRITDSPHLTGLGELKKRYKNTLGAPWVFTIELPLSHLIALAQCIALVLAQPALKNWDSADLVQPPEFG